jgi:DNA-binding CsgD family transcriptional regulator
MAATLEYREQASVTRPPTALIGPTGERHGDLRERLALRILEQLPLAIVAIDALGNLVLANAAARAMPAALGCIAGYTPELIRRLEQTGSGALAATCGERQFWFLAALVADQEPGRRPLFTVTITEPAAAHPVAAGTIAQLCGLTPSEARTAEMILAGTAPKSMAQALGVSLATIKTHLHRVFSKTRTRGQADFARRMARVTPPGR